MGRRTAVLVLLPAGALAAGLLTTAALAGAAHRTADPLRVPARDEQQAVRQAQALLARVWLPGQLVVEAPQYALALPGSTVELERTVDVPGTVAAAVGALQSRPPAGLAYRRPAYQTSSTSAPLATQTAELYVPAPAAVGPWAVVDVSATAEGPSLVRLTERARVGWSPS